MAMALTAALLNLGGLGLGYVYLRRGRTFGVHVAGLVLWFLLAS